MTKRVLCILLLFLLGIVAFSQNTSFALPDSLQNLLTENNKANLKRCEILQTIIKTLHEQKQFELSKTYVDELNSLSKQLNIIHFKAYSEYYQGGIIKAEGDLPQALKHFQDAKETAKDLPNNNSSYTLKVKIQIALGSTYVSMSMFPQAYLNLQEGIEINKTLCDNQIQFELENYLLVIYLYLNLDEEIITISKKALVNANYSDFNKYFLHYNIAACHTELHHFDSARMYLDSALIYAETKRDSALVPYYRGSINIEEQNYRQSLTNFDESLKIIRGSIYKDVESNSLVYKGLAYTKLGIYDSAFMAVDTGLLIAETNNNLYIVERGLAIKQDLLYETGDYEEYAKVSRYYNRIEDSLKVTENIGRLQQLELEHQFKLTKEQMAQAQLVKDMKNERKLLMLLLVIAILALVIVITLLLLNKNKMILKNKKIQEEAMARELELKKRELTAKALVQTQRQEILTDIINKLDGIQDDKKKMSDNIQAIINDFKQYRNSQTPEDFDHYFTQTHPVFYKNHERDFPNLSPYEMRLCAYIRLGLNTKSIAQISGIEPSSVRMARHRLRKSLGIVDSETDLVKFLSKY